MGLFVDAHVNSNLNEVVNVFYALIFLKFIPKFLPFVSLIFIWQVYFTFKVKHAGSMYKVRCEETYTLDHITSYTRLYNIPLGYDNMNINCRATSGCACNKLKIIHFFSCKIVICGMQTRCRFDHLFALYLIVFDDKNVIINQILGLQKNEFWSIFLKKLYTDVIILSLDMIIS